MGYSAILDGSSSPFLASVHSVHSYLSTTQPASFLPFNIFSIIHATRIACAYRGGARAGGFNDRIGMFQAAMVPLILILGGTTVTGMLMGIIPGWLISPIPVATYGILPLLAYQTGVVSFLLSLPALPRELTFCLVDGFSRIVGITTFGVDTVLAHPNTALRNSPWAMIIVATIAGGGGGMIVPAFRGFHADWGIISTPGWVKDGPGIDIWGATVIGYVYSTLIDAHPFFRILPNALFGHLPILSSYFPKTYLTNAASTPLLPAHEAKIFCSLLLAAMLSVRVLQPAFSSTFGSKPRKTVKLNANKSIASAQNAVASKKVAAFKEKKSQ